MGKGSAQVFVNVITTSLALYLSQLVIIGVECNSVLTQLEHP